MKVTANQRRQLRSLAHHLKPVVTIGNAGLSPAVSAEIEQAIAHHELIKVRIQGAERAIKRDIAKRIQTKTDAVIVQEIGHILVLYRAAKPARIQLEKH